MTGAQPIEVQSIQAAWLRQWHRYMIGTYAADCADALEVGCGSGCVMKNIDDLLLVKGVDIDPEQVDLAKDRGLTVETGDAASLVYRKDSFDLVYTSFLFMWLDRPERVLEEMTRVARKKVMFLSEPVWGRSLFSPSWLSKLVETEMDVIGEEGGRPDAGLDLVRLLGEKDLNFRFGTVPMDTSPEEVRRWVRVECEYLASKGRRIASGDVCVFHVPFIWAVVDLS